MSQGIVVCSTCKHEVHQDGPAAAWQHCDDGSPRCDGAQSVYPASTGEIEGKWCGRDAEPTEARVPITVLGDDERNALSLRAEDDGRLTIEIDRPRVHASLGITITREQARWLGQVLLRETTPAVTGGE
jgi:hypothetical protein